MSETAATAAPAATPLLPPLYSALEPLTPQRHSDLRLRDAGYAFAARISAIPLAFEEFSPASRHYPIVFTAQAPHMPMVIMSLAADANPQVDANGVWQAGKYIPAYLRRFPFFLVRVAEGSDELALCMDTAAPQISTTEGEILFGADGKPTPILDQAFAFSRSLEAAMQKTRALTDLLTSLNLLQPTAVQREAFAALPAEKLAELRDNGALELIYAHLASMAALPELTARLAAAPPAPAL